VSIEEKYVSIKAMEVSVGPKGLSMGAGVVPSLTACLYEMTVVTDGEAARPRSRRSLSGLRGCRERGRQRLRWRPGLKSWATDGGPLRDRGFVFLGPVGTTVGSPGLQPRAELRHTLSALEARAGERMVRLVTA
jgi:hypothetical protein